MYSRSLAPASPRIFDFGISRFAVLGKLAVKKGATEYLAQLPGAGLTPLVHILDSGRSRGVSLQQVLYFSQPLDRSGHAEVECCQGCELEQALCLARVVQVFTSE